MTLLTSPSDCKSCVNLSQKISVLEQKIATLNKIQILAARPVPAPAPDTIPEGSWLRLGTKPEALVCSTTSHTAVHQPWVVDGNTKKRGRLSFHPIHQGKGSCDYTSFGSIPFFFSSPYCAWQFTGHPNVALHLCQISKNYYQLSTPNTIEF